MADKKKKTNAAEGEETEQTTPVSADTADKPEVEEPRQDEPKEPDYKAELNGANDRYLRLLAEYDNYRKRTANEKLGIYDDATSKAVTEILPVADSVRMALENLKDSDPEIIKGVELIKSQLDRSFEKLKIESYGEVGDEFDPNLHNAISMVDSEELKSNQIAAVFQTGYKIGDKIIRHAMVQVVN